MTSVFILLSIQIFNGLGCIANNLGIEVATDLRFFGIRKSTDNLISLCKDETTNNAVRNYPSHFDLYDSHLIEKINTSRSTQAQSL